MKITLISFLTALCFFGQAYATADTPVDLQTRYGHYYATYLVNDDGTATVSHEWTNTILKETALKWAKQASVSYSTSSEKAEVVAAYTLKANGRHIDAPKENYQVEVNSGKGKDSPVYSDRTTLTVVFPNVEVGDTVMFSYKITQTEPIFPKHYSTMQTFYNQVAYDDVRIRFDYPISLWVQYEARGMKETESITKGDRKIIEWHYANPKPIKTERRDFSVIDLDKEAGYAFSTFKTYAEISSAYGERALPKAIITERITKLATEIVKDNQKPIDQARSLYEWVATNITYAGNCIGIGAVVPRDLAFILDNKMGDCKDHATLLQALLAARNIKSTQALVNAGSVYQLPRIPVVASVNHVINYLPEFDLYLDSTSDSTPFGMLPFGDQDKPILLVDGFRAGAKTPVPPIGTNNQQTKIVMKITTDGSLSGNVEVFQNGLGAIDTRHKARNIPKNVEEDLVKNMFRNQGLVGSGKLEKDDPKGLGSSYHFKVSLNAEKFIKLPGAGAFYIYPPINLVSPIHDFLRTSLEPEKEADVVCSSIAADEEYVIELPKGIKILSIPDDMKIANEFVSYTATYKLNGDDLTVKRTLDDRTKGNICSPKIFSEYKKIAEKAMDNLKEQVLYK